MERKGKENSETFSIKGSFKLEAVHTFLPRVSTILPNVFFNVFKNEYFSPEMAKIEKKTIGKERERKEEEGETQRPPSFRARLDQRL